MSEFQSIQSIGRSGLIDEIKSVLKSRNPRIVFGIGDDSAVLSPEPGKQVLFSSESFIEGIDFDISYSPLNHLGYKLLSAVISDIYAMNARPIAANINISVPNKFSVQMVKDLFMGFDSCCEVHEMQISGGDLNASFSNLVISISAIGEAEDDKLIYRSGAQIDDAICITGDLGGAIAGLRILMREKQIWQEDSSGQFSPELEHYEYVVRRQLVPEARKDLIDTFQELDILPSSMIDITKGLSNELIELCKSSKRGARLYEAAIPVSVDTRNVANELQEDVMKYAFFGGEDLEMLFTLPKEEIEVFGKHFADFSVIGKIAPEGEDILIQTAEGDIVALDELSY